MRFPLRLRVVALVTVFNLAVFGGGLAWVAGRITGERAQQAGTDRELVIERLLGLLERGGGRVAGDVLAWPRWALYDDAMVVQLRAPDTAQRSGVLEDLDRVARTGEVEFVPRGKVSPLRPPARRRKRVVGFPPEGWELLVAPGIGPPDVMAAYGLSHWMRSRFVMTVPYLEKRLRGPVWGAVFLPSRFMWPWELAQHMAFLGLSRQRQGAQDRVIEPSIYLRRAMETARHEDRPIEIEGGALLPLRNEQGLTWGAAFLPYRQYQALDLWPCNWGDRGLRSWVWPWNFFRDAAIHGLPEFGFGPPPVEMAGLHLNPLGSAHRSADFDQAAVLEDLSTAARDDEWLSNERGLAVPLRLRNGQLWGGVWLRPRPQAGLRVLLRELVPWFLITTVLLTLATFFGVQNLVLDPVRRLARGARRLAAGDLAARIPELPRRDEMADLVRSFNAMAGQVQGFNARLEYEVDFATQQAREAEGAAMTQRRLAATGELAAGIAHEINNPLGGMLNALEVLAREDLDPARREQYLELLRGGLERIRTTVGGVLRLAPRETRIEPVALVDPIGDALGLVRHRAEGQSVQLVLEGLGGARDLSTPDALEPWRALPPVMGQSNELGQAILNLLVNALDAVEEPEDGGGGEVRIGLDGGDGALLVWITDNGPGMDPDLLPRAADIFFTTKDAGRGTGLGLAIVHNVIGGHGGSVQLHNRAEGGFRVDIELPLAPLVDAPIEQEGRT